MLKLAMIIIGLTVTSAFAQDDQPQPPEKVFPTAFTCHSTEFIFEDLTKKYGEEPIALGKGVMRSAKNGQFYHGSIILWKNQKTRSWTLTITPDGDEDNTCYILSGSDFTEVSTGIPTKL